MMEARGKNNDYTIATRKGPPLRHLSPHEVAAWKNEDGTLKDIHSEVMKFCRHFHIEDRLSPRRWSSSA